MLQQLPAAALSLPWAVQRSLMCVLSSSKLDTLGVSSELIDSIQQAQALPYTESSPA
jgi:hypothetical protein